MMNKNYKNILVPLIAIWLTGILLHFVYAWSNQSAIAAIFGAVNESVWEHGKLAFWPLTLFFLIQALRKKLSFRDAFVGAAVSCFTAVGLMIMLYYTFTGATGLESLIFDICLFLFVTFIGLIWGNKASAMPDKSPLTYFGAAVAFLLLFMSYLLFTFFPPSFPLFIPPGE